MKKWIKQDQPTPVLARKRPGAPKDNQNGRRHGLYSRLYPVDFIDTLPRLRHEQGHSPWTLRRRAGLIPSAQCNTTRFS